jgi:hypothetical protein
MIERIKERIKKMSQSNGPTKRNSVPPSLQRNSSLPIQIKPQQPTGFFDLPSDMHNDDDGLITQSHSAPGTMIFGRGSNNSSKASSASNSSRTSYRMTEPPPLTAPCWFTLPESKNEEPKLGMDQQLLNLVAKIKLEFGLQLHILISGGESTRPVLALTDEQNTSSANPPVLNRFALNNNISKRDILRTMLAKIDIGLAKYDLLKLDIADFEKELKDVLCVGLANLKKRREIHSDTTNKIKGIVEGFIQELDDHLKSSTKCTSTNSNTF